MALCICMVDPPQSSFQCPLHHFFGPKLYGTEGSKSNTIRCIQTSVSCGEHFYTSKDVCA